jgi:hypothetical protein
MLDEHVLIEGFSDTPIAVSFLVERTIFATSTEEIGSKC